MSGDNPNSSDILLNLESHDFHCEHCWHFYKFKDQRTFAEQYFRHNARFKCEECSELIDWWAATLKSIRKAETNTAEEICLPIGARRSALEVALHPNQILRIVFADTGIPADAIILNINYNSIGRGPGEGNPVQAVEILTNPLIRRLESNAATFYGAPHGDPPYADVGIHIGITWVPNKPDDISWEYLVNAFQYYLDDRYHGALIAANAAVETYLGRLMREVFEENASRDHVRAFMQDAATYSHQLNVLLPTLVDLTNAPPLRDDIRGQLNRLRNQRNNLAHGKITPQSIDMNAAAESLCAAVFGVRYLDVVELYL